MSERPVDAFSLKHLWFALCFAVWSLFLPLLPPFCGFEVSFADKLRLLSSKVKTELAFQRYYFVDTGKCEKGLHSFCNYPIPNH